MGNLSAIGRIFFAIAIAVIGFLAIYYGDFPYMLIPPDHQSIPGLSVFACLTGTLFIISGASFVFKKKTRPVALLLGTLLLLNCCFYFIPYELIATTKYMQWGEWENAEKELALAAGALVVAGCFAEENETLFSRISGKLIPWGAVLFSITMICFGVDHFLFTKEASTLVPSWIPFPIFWVYAGGVGLLGSGIAIILKIRRGPVAALLGSMIFIWFVILHIPRVVASASEDRGGELTSAMLALAYSGIALMIAGMGKPGDRD
jgi:uncharacterized membrane protein